MVSTSVILIAVLLLIAIVATVAVGMSKENREGNPDYEKRTKGNWTRLTLHYVITGIVGVVAIIVFVTSR